MDEVQGSPQTLEEAWYGRRDRHVDVSTGQGSFHYGTCPEDGQPFDAWARRQFHLAMERDNGNTQ